MLKNNVKYYHMTGGGDRKNSTQGMGPPRVLENSTQTFGIFHQFQPWSRDAVSKMISKKHFI